MTLPTKPKTSKSSLGGEVEGNESSQKFSNWQKELKNKVTRTEIRRPKTFRNEKALHDMSFGSRNEINDTLMKNQEKLRFEESIISELSKEESKHFDSRKKQVKERAKIKRFKTVAELDVKLKERLEKIEGLEEMGLAHIQQKKKLDEFEETPKRIRKSQVKMDYAQFANQNAKAQDLQVFAQNLGDFIHQEIELTQDDEQLHFASPKNLDWMKINVTTPPPNRNLLPVQLNQEEEKETHTHFTTPLDQSLQEQPDILSSPKSDSSPTKKTLISPPQSPQYKLSQSLKIEDF